MLALRCRCSLTACLLSLSLLLSGASVVVAQNAKGASGQNCGCGKTGKGLVPAVPNPLFVQQPATSAMATQTKHHDPKHHHANTQQTGVSAPPMQTGIYPGQTTPWLMPNQPVGNPNQPLTRQPNSNLQQPITGQPGYNFGQPNQQMVWQFQPVVNPNTTGFGGPAYIPPQPNQPGNLLNNPNQPVNGQLIPVVVVQPGYLVPVQNPTNNVQYQPSPTSTPWMLQTGMVPNQTGSMQNCTCHKQNHLAPGQTVAYQNPSFGAQNQTQQRTTPGAGHGQHGSHCKQK